MVKNKFRGISDFKWVLTGLKTVGWRGLSLFVLLFGGSHLSRAAVNYDELACFVTPRTIRAYSVATNNSICLRWPANDLRQEVRISRRVYSPDPSEWQEWGTEIYTVTDPARAKEAGQYCDTSVTSGIHYEYQIVAFIPDYLCDYRTANPYWYYQYINTGTEVPLKDERGHVILLVESSLATPLLSELATLENDLIGDGYKVVRHDVSAVDVDQSGWANAVKTTKALIQADFNADRNADWTLLIVGHVPIPYSGVGSPGGHTDNVGAHPADYYYADMDESAWTDATANNTTSDWPHHWNIPADGKFDQTRVPSALELRIGRVDLRTMPAFGKSEVELLRQYLNRNHAWRHRQFVARERGLVNENNNGGLIYKGLPIDSHNTFSSFLGGTDHIDLGSWLGDAMSPGSSYLFAASAGNGQYTRDLQIGWTTDFAATPLHVVFTSMHGSYYGDWDSSQHPDEVLQAPLATEGYVLSNYYHEDIMNVDSSAMGEPIGQELFALGSDLFSRPNAHYLAARWIHEGQTYSRAPIMNNYKSLLGDPTLRMRVVAPPTKVTVSVEGADNIISWTVATDTNIQGYHVYRAPKTNHNNFTRVTNSPLSAASYRDVNAASGAYDYMVRTVKLETSANRSYYNASQAGLSWRPDISSGYGIPLVSAGTYLSLVLPANQIELNGTASDPDNGPNPLTTTWAQLSGPVGVTFTDPASLTAVATFPGEGTYRLTLTAEDGKYVVVATATIRVFLPSHVNVPPAVSAGVDGTITLPTNRVTLNGSANDPDAYPSELSSTWTVVGNPPGVSVGNPYALEAFATFSSSGVYTLRLTVTDGMAVTTDEVQVTVLGAATPPSTAPSHNARFMPFKTVFKPSSELELRIRCHLEVASEISLKVYARKGNFVKTIFEGHHGAGDVNDLAWDGRNEKGEIVASGMYILHLKAGGETTTKKVIVVR